jgi:hypothetical protein
MKKPKAIRAEPIALPKPKQRSAEDANWMREADIQGALTACERILATCFRIEVVMQPIFEAAVVFLLINLNDLLQKAKTDGARISFTDHIALNDRVSDVTDLVSKMRNAACHLGSPENDIGISKFRFCTVAGKQNAIMLGDLAIGCEFEDDIAIYYGRHRLYVRRHVARAIEELRNVYPSR